MTSSSRPPDCCDVPDVVAPLSESDRQPLVAVFKALGDGTRLEVFRLIAGQSAPICVCDIVEQFDVSQPTISHHLRALREAGLIRASRRGNWAFYDLDPQGLSIAERFLGQARPAIVAR